MLNTTGHKHTGVMKLHGIIGPCGDPSVLLSSSYLSAIAAASKEMVCALRGSRDLMP